MIYPTRQKGTFAEHFPKHPDGKEALCGQKNKPIVLDLLSDNDPEMWCHKCRNKACVDCGGSGIIGGGETGIYCRCSYANFAMVRNGDLDDAVLFYE